MPSGPNSHDFVYVHTDIPEGMTIREWRAERAARAAKFRDVQRRARRARTPAIFIESLRRLLGELGLRAAVRALRWHWQSESR
jgi:hypothetical protein